MSGRPATGSPAGRPGVRDVVRSPHASGRDTVESIVVAFVLALLFRSFEAEAFVIPTGSMANTLMGRHRDITCETCGAAFRAGTAAELDEGTCSLNPLAFVERARCPNCGAVTRLTDAAGRYRHEYPPFTGDRIIVEKFAYDFVDPARWDVVVFKYPEDARVNYIKRLVGLPGETVFIAGGDIWTSRDGRAPEIARKPPARLRAMLQPVSDSRHVAEPLRAAGWPDAWSDWSATGEAARWTSDDGGRSFAVAPGDRPATLRWRRFVPPGWEPGAPPPGEPRPALVGDFQPYNDNSKYLVFHFDEDLGALVDGANWVGDLALECDLEAADGTGSVRLDLVKEGVRHSCTFDLASGRATLAREAAGEVRGQGLTPVRGRGRWRVMFANVDDELSLFVNGRRIATDTPTTWQRSLADAAESRPVVLGGRPGDPEPDDLAPAGITVAGERVRVGNLRILRDIFYIASGDESALLGKWPAEPALDFRLGPDQFFVLGDNSAASADGRAWGTREAPLHHVDRRLLIGRAVVVFWPHAVPTAWNVNAKPVGSWPFRCTELRLPCLPNFARMRFVR